jgi:hypothetical protein
MKPEIRLVKEKLRQWDPIGVIPDLIADGLPPNEYDTYAPTIVGMLQRDCTPAELAHHLEYCRTLAMGLPANRAAGHEFAERLVAFWKERH